MCGRFENKVREEWMVDKFAEFDVAIIFKTDTQKRKFENIAPTNSIVSITNKEDNLFADLDKWGIKFSSKSPLIFNSRIETIAAKPFWKRMFNYYRCIVPMTAFYEWKKIDNKKVPLRISLKKDEVFFVPAIFHKDKEETKFISLITTEPNSFMKKIHNRMPVILSFKDAIAFLDDNTDQNIERCVPYQNSKNMTFEYAII